MTSAAQSLLLRINEHILNPTIILLFAVATVVFLWGLVQFLIDTDSDTGRSDGKKEIMYGLIGMFIMVSVFGIVSLALNTFGISTNTGFISF